MSCETKLSPREASFYVSSKEKKESAPTRENKTEKERQPRPHLLKPPSHSLRHSSHLSTTQVAPSQQHFHSDLQGFAFVSVEIDDSEEFGEGGGFGIDLGSVGVGGGGEEEMMLED